MDTATLQEQTLDRLREQETLLSTQRVFDWLSNLPPDRKAKFKHYRAQLTAARVSLENAVLQQIANQLSTYESDFKAGCDNLQTEIAALNNTSAILKSLANVTNVLSRIVRVLA